MEEINSLFHGFAVIMTPMNFLLMVIGIVLGVLIGVLPGLGGACLLYTSPSPRD